MVENELIQQETREQAKKFFKTALWLLFIAFNIYITTGLLETDSIPELSFFDSLLMTGLWWLMFGKYFDKKK